MSTTKSTLMDGVRTLYNRTIRPVTPRKVGYFNDVAVKKLRYFDQTVEHPNYEETLIERVKETVEPGDHVGIVGGGIGVSAVWAARCGGEVTVYEAAADQVNRVRETAELNDQADSITVEHALVGEDVNVWGAVEDATELHPDDLPEFDVLVIDCEGGETSILPSFSADRVVVETHGWLGSPASEVKAQLREADYEIVDERIDLPRYENKMLTAERRA